MLLQRDTPLNFVELILDLRRHPHRLKLTTIAAAINVPESTLKGWFYDGHMPNYEDARALLKFYQRVMESSRGDEIAPRKALQLASHARNPSPPAKEYSMAKKPKTVKIPGEEAAAEAPAQPGGESDPDAAIVAGQAGKARKIAKPRAAVAPSKVKGDPQRPADAAVNAKREMPYAEAMKLLEAGELKRSVLTEKGWVAPPNRVPPSGARI